MNRITGLVIIVAMVLVACGGNQQQERQRSGQQATGGQAESGLTEFQLENGIGPVTEEVTLGPLQEEMAEKGEQIFKTKCSACHKMSERYVGPPLGDIFEKRTPAYVMNMMLNPAEMLDKHPEAKKMLAEYMTPMTFQNVSREDARAIVEYLRYQQEGNENDEES